MSELEQYSQALCPWGYKGKVDELKRYHLLSKMSNDEREAIARFNSLVHALYRSGHAFMNLQNAAKLEGLEISSVEHETIATKDPQPLEQSIDAGIDFGSEQHTVDAFAYRVQALKKQSLMQSGETLIKAITDYRCEVAEIDQEDLHNQHPELSHLGYYDRFTKL